MTRARRSFDREYKREAVRMVVEGGRPVSQVARELGVRPDLLRHWKHALEQDGAVIRPPPKNQDEEIRRLEREVAVLRQERDFLKKATAYFAKGSERGTP
jgi:transposase